MIIEERGGFPVCLAEFPWVVSQGQTIVLGTALVLGLTAVLFYRWRTRRNKYRALMREDDGGAR